MINENVIKGKWKELKGAVQKEWGKLTDDELEQSKGDVTSLSGTIQKKYGVAQEGIREKLNEMVAKFGESKNEENPYRNEVREDEVVANKEQPSVKRSTL